tara:strand:+ start:288 stop:830 length:543 start_codon:yes stop_codon:yes gene_type:complete
MKIEIQDNFLSNYHADFYDDIFNGIREGENAFPWYFNNNLNDIKSLGNYYFTHVVLDSKREDNPHSQNILNQDLIDIFDPLVSKLHISKNQLKRIKVNMYPRTQSRVHHQSHRDYGPNCNMRTCLYYVNTNNGITKFDGTFKFVRSKKNRAIFFDGSNPHHSTTPTNENYRCSINIDYQL